MSLLTFLLGQFTLGLLVLFSAIIIHEVAHVLHADRLGYSEVKLRFNWKEGGFFVNLPPAMSKRDKLSVLNAGIWTGFGFLAITGLIIDWWVVYVMILILYYFGTQHDMKNIKRLQKAIKKTEKGF